MEKRPVRLARQGHADPRAFETPGSSAAAANTNDGPAEKVVGSNTRGWEYHGIPVRSEIDHAWRSCAVGPVCARGRIVNEERPWHQWRNAGARSTQIRAIPGGGRRFKRGLGRTPLERRIISLSKPVDRGGRGSARVACSCSRPSGRSIPETSVPRILRRRVPALLPMCLVPSLRK